MGISAFYIWGGAIFILSLALWWWASRYDLKGKALESAWQTARGKRTAENPTALERDLAEITDEATVTGKATKAAGKVAGHFIGQLLSLVGLLGMLLGLALAAIGWLWR
jgi:hypothetical protein